MTKAKGIRAADDLMRKLVQVGKPPKAKKKARKKKN